MLDLRDARRDVRMRLADASDDVEPGDDGPQPVLLADVVAARAEALLAADGQLVGVEERAEELPARGHLVAVEALGRGDEVDGAGGRHAAREAVDALFLEVGDELGMVSNNRQAIARGDEGVGAVDHVAVAVAVAGGAEVDVVRVDDLDEGVGVGEVGVGVAAVEVGRGDAVLGAVGEAELALEDGLAVGAGDAGEAVEEDLEVLVLGEEALDQVEVEDVLQHLKVVGDGVDDLDLEGAVGASADRGDVDLGDVGDFVGGQGFGDLEDAVRDGLWGWTAVGEVVLDTEVVLWAL